MFKHKEHSNLKPMCHQCQTCNTCAELGNINNVVRQAGTAATSPSNQPRDTTQIKKESLSERFERWSKDHEQRINKTRDYIRSDIGIVV